MIGVQGEQLTGAEVIQKPHPKRRIGEREEERGGVEL